MKRQTRSFSLLLLAHTHTHTLPPQTHSRGFGSFQRKLRWSQCYFTWMIFPHDFPIFVLGLPPHSLSLSPFARYLSTGNSFCVPPACHHDHGRPTVDDDTRNNKIDSTSPALTLMWCVRGYSGSTAATNAWLLAADYKMAINMNVANVCLVCAWKLHIEALKASTKHIRTPTQSDCRCHRCRHPNPEASSKAHCHHHHIHIHVHVVETIFFTLHGHV